MNKFFSRRNNSLNRYVICIATPFKQLIDFQVDILSSVSKFLEIVTDMDIDYQDSRTE